jgi:hypothetical protein
MKIQTAWKRVLEAVSLGLRVIACLPIILLMILVVPIIAKLETGNDLSPY